jgi:outer membrane murein-binding lipoprotein Lpp
MADDARERRAMRLAAICVGALVLAGCGADEAANEIRDTVDPVAEAADNMAASGGARVDEVVDISEEIAEQIGDG